MNKKDYNYRIEITLGNVCNFNCKYCYNNTMEFRIKSFLDYEILRKKRMRDIDIAEIFQKLGKHRYHIVFTGGEPFIFPGFIKLVKNVSKSNYVSVITNLSTRNINTFADEIDPEKVKFIFISLHIEELEKFRLVDEFISKVKYLKKRGFNIFVSYVMYPPLFERFESDYIFFKSHGIIIFPKLFKGAYNKKIYPASYSDDETRLMMKYMNNETKMMLNSNLDFRGKECQAGKVSVVVKENGKVYRCWGDKKPIGNFFKADMGFFDENKPCRARECICPNEGLIFSEKMPKAKNQSPP